MISNYENSIIYILLFLLFFSISFSLYFKKIREKELSKKGKRCLIGYLAIFFIGNILLFVLSKNGEILRGEMVSFCISSIIFCSIMDVLYSEIYSFEMFLCEIGLVGLPILFNYKFGCSCIMKYNIYAFVLFIVVRLMNNLFNKETFIGSADIDLFCSVLFGFISVLLSINERVQLSIFVIGEIVSNFTTFILVSICIYFVFVVIYYNIKKINKSYDEISNKSFKEKIKDLNSKFRVLPVFILPYIYTCLLLYSQ